MIQKDIYLLQWFMMGLNENDSVIQTMRWFLPNPGPILDIGSGTGYMALGMKSLMPELEFVLLNISDFQLGLTPRFSQLKWDAKNIPYPFGDGEFKNIMASYSLGHVGRLDTFMKECARLLDKDGLLYIWDMSSYKPEAVAETLHYVCYNSKRVISEAAHVGLRPVRCGSPFPVSFQEKAMAFDLFNEAFNCYPVAYLFEKL